MKNFQNYSFRDVEKKWQDKWVDESTFQAVDFHPTKPKYYVLYEFFNISGNLHMGHLKGTVPSDALARYKRFCGYNVLFPIGGDAFGLPAENAAIKSGIKPADFVANGMEKVINQSRMLGLSFDWNRTICTSDPDYYKWTQWIFLQLLKHGKAYRQIGHVNFCPNCQTVLSNEDCQSGKCDRCGGEVVQKEREVWFLKMKEYSEKLLENINNIDLPEYLKETQRNWIGKSEGITLTLQLENSKGDSLGTVDIYTTCIETIYGVTYLVLAPENALIGRIKKHIENPQDVNDYIQQTTKKSDFERMSDSKSKTGCLVGGVWAINPVTRVRVPIYLADFVLNNYGTGAVMAVPAHDQRDYEFAKKFNIPMVQVIEGNCSDHAVEKQEYLGDNRRMVFAEEFTGMPVNTAKELIANKVVEMGYGKYQINYRMQDWPFNRQRYWGEPFPVIYCEKCGVVALPEDQLPLQLPDVDDYLPNRNGDSPLSKAYDWVNCTCPKCGAPARRETDTMPNWAGSSWYWLRYTDPYNTYKLADFEKLKYWGSVDCYTGGTEHITRHVLYAFFWQNFLYEIGAVPTRDPFVRKMGSGLILDDEGKKMSKSSANGVSPMEVIEKYGADVARLHLHFLGGYEDNVPWTYKGINGITSFLDKVWSLQGIVTEENAISKKHLYLMNRLIKKISEDIESFSLNTAIAAFMSFIKQVKVDDFITLLEMKYFLILLNPLAPHITSELFEIVFNSQITDEQWPQYDEKYLIEDTINLPIQIKGKMYKLIQINRDATQEDVLKQIKQQYPSVPVDGASKIVYVPNRIINIIP